MKPADPATLWAIVVLLEAIKAVGLFAVGAGQPAERICRRTPAASTQSANVILGDEVSERGEMTRVFPILRRVAEGCIESLGE